MATAILFLRLFIAAHPVVAPTVHGRPSALVLDMSGPAEPESIFPSVVAKGRL